MEGRGIKNVDRAQLPNYAGRNWSGEIFRGTLTYMTSIRSGGTPKADKGGEVA